MIIKKKIQWPTFQDFEKSKYKQPTKEKIWQSIDNLIEVSTFFYATWKVKKAQRLDDVIDKLINYNK